jgi:fructokinase
VIVVAGEALVDLAVPSDDPRHPAAHPGGSPANVALTLARLGRRVTFVGRSGEDAFGQLTREHLRDNGVDLGYVVRAAEPSSLAVVSIGADGAASYSFHVEGTADWAWTAAELPAELPGDVLAVHAGSLALVLPPGGRVLEAWLARQRGVATVSLDPNVRPALVGPRDPYRGRLESWVAMSDIVKVSAEDLAWVYPGTDPLDVAARWLQISGGPRLVVVTFGADGAAACIDGHVIRRPAPPTAVVDTVGAGDAFSGGLLDWLAGHDRLHRAGLHTLTVHDAAAAVDFASTVAAATCRRPGADPPHRHELIAHTAPVRAVHPHSDRPAPSCR